MFKVQSYEAHVGACLPCDLAMVAGAGLATVGAGSMFGDTSQITESKFFIPGVVAAAALVGYGIAKYTCGCGH